MALNTEFESLEKSHIRSGDKLGSSVIASQLWSATEMRSLSKTAGVMPAQFGELTLTDDSAPLQLADKNTNERKKENSQSAENSKGVRVGEDKDWNLQYGNDQTNLGMPNAIDKGTVNMQVNREGTVRVYQWGADAKNADGTIRDRRVDVDKYNNTHVGLHAHAQKLEVPADDTAKSVHGQILRK